MASQSLELVGMDVRPLSVHRNPCKEENKNMYNEFKVIPSNIMQARVWIWKVGWFKETF